MTIYTEISRKSQSHAAYVADAIALLIEDCDWVNASDDNILVFTNKHGDFVAIPDIYYGEGTEFNTTKGVSVILTDKNGKYIAVEA